MIREKASATLLSEAQHHDANGLHRLGKHILHVIAPEVGEAQEAKLLAREEEAARQQVRWVSRDDGHGTSRGWYTIPTHLNHNLRKMLLALAAPKRHPGQPRAASPRRMGAALCELIERYPANRLPKAGGQNATVVVMMELDTLLGGITAASLDTGAKITAGEARRIACEAGIIPAVPRRHLGQERTLLWPRHHRRTHDRRYTQTQLPNGKIAFHRRT